LKPFEQLNQINEPLTVKGHDFRIKYLFVLFSEDDKRTSFKMKMRVRIIDYRIHRWCTPLACYFRSFLIRLIASYVGTDAMEHSKGTKGRIKGKMVEING
jgi:hypothetical protein